MKNILLVLLFSIQAFAVTESIQGYGTSNGFCRGDGFAYMCINQLENQAKQYATRDAESQCRSRQGNLITYSGYCFNTCNPASIPPNFDAYVSCTSRCRFDCEMNRP